MVAALCATFMTNLCLTSSVGAIKPSDILRGFNEETRKHVYEINDRVSDLDWNISTTIKNVDKVRDRVGQILNKQLLMVGGPNDDTYEALGYLENIKKSLTDTYNLKLCHDEITDIVEKSLESIDRHINYMLKTDTDGLVYYILEKYDSLETNTRVIKKGLQFSTELDDKRFALHKAGVFIKKMNDSLEKSNLKKQYDEAQNYYNSIIRTVTYANKSGREQAQRFFDLADKAINEVNKVRDARGNNVSSKNELPAPMARENKNNNKPNKIQELIAKFDKQKQDKAKLEKARKDVERQLKKMDERIKKEREEQKRQKEERAKKKEKLKQEERRLEEESKQLNEKANRFGNVRAIYNGWYTSIELPVIERLMEIEYRLQEIRSDLMNMDMPKIFGNSIWAFKNKNEEKTLVRKKLEINRKYVNLRNELSSIAFLRTQGIHLDSNMIEHNIKAAEKEMYEINEKIKQEIERQRKFSSEIGALNSKFGYKKLGK